MLFAFHLEQESKGAKVFSDTNNNIGLWYPDGRTVIFDRHLKTRDGYVQGVRLVPVVRGEQSLSAKEDGQTNDTIPSDTYHQMLGHPSMAITRSTAHARNVTLSGDNNKTICVNCQMAKAWIKPISKERD